MERKGSEWNGGTWYWKDRDGTERLGMALNETENFVTERKGSEWNEKDRNRTEKFGMDRKARNRAKRLGTDRKGSQ